MFKSTSKLYHKSKLLFTPNHLVEYLSNIHILFLKEGDIQNLRVLSNLWRVCLTYATCHQRKSKARVSEFLPSVSLSHQVQIHGLGMKPYDLDLFHLYLFTCGPNNGPLLDITLQAYESFAIFLHCWKKYKHLSLW